MAETNGGGRSAGERMAEDRAGGRVVIKKYANRRLYNTAKSSYVTLDDLARMVRAGEDFAVYDAKTGEDITRSVLTQIIVEEESRDHNMLPTTFLRELIRLYGDPMRGMVPGYLDATMEAFTRNQDQLRRAFGGNAAMENFEQLARSNMELFERSLRMFSPFGPGAGGQPTGGPAPKEPEPARKAEPGPGRQSEMGDDLEGLQKQLREMQAQLERLSRAKK